MYQALYRKWRPRRFDEVIGQSAITDTLQNQLRQGRVSHAYLFTGTRGTGKTTCAKLLARAVNCESPEDGNPCNRCAACTGILSGTVPEVLELDAASNTGVDNIRGLLDEVVYPPVDVKKRVYIIDEVHMLSIGAFNALLKTLEEPPEHVLFILATTELHKVPATILSRCQRFDFRRVDVPTLKENLARIASAEGTKLTDGAAELLSRLADGSVRDSLSLLERCMAEGADGALDEAAVSACLGLSPDSSLFGLARAAAENDAARALALIDALYRDGRDMRAVLSGLASLLRDALVMKTAGEGGAALVRTDQIGEVGTLAGLYETPRLLSALRLLQETVNRLSRSSAGRLEVELCLIRMCEPSLSAESPASAAQAAAPSDAAALNALSARVVRLESRLTEAKRPASAGGSAPAAPAAASSGGKPPEEKKKASGAQSPAPGGGKGTPPVRELPEKQCDALLSSLKGKIVPSALTHLRLSKLACEDGVFRILVDDEMSKKLLDDRGVRDAVRDAAQKLLGCPLRVAVELLQEDGGFGGFDSILESCRDEGVAIRQK